MNVFAPSGSPADRSTVNRYADRLHRQSAALGVALGDPRFDDDDYQQKVDLLEQEGVAVVSFTFGCPSPAVVQRLQRVQTSVWVTVTDPQEAVLAVDAGVDALVVQGVEAGGHRGSFVDADSHEDYGILALLSLVADRVDLPLVAAGGIATGSALAGVLAGGAAARQGSRQRRRGAGQPVGGTGTRARRSGAGRAGPGHPGPRCVSRAQQSPTHVAIADEHPCQ